MRVLIISGSFPPMRCGVGDYTNHLALSLSNIPQLTIAVLTNIGAALPPHGREITLLPIVNAWEWREFATILGAIRRWMPDIIHIQYPTLGYVSKGLPWTLPLLLRLAGYPIVQTWHEVEPLSLLLKSGTLFSFIARALAPGGLVVVRRDFCRLADRVLRWAFINKTVRFIPSASAIPNVDLSAAERCSLRKRYARPNSDMIAYFGFIGARKRVELLFEIADSNTSHIVIIGDVFRDDELRQFPQSLRIAITNYHDSIKKLASEERWKGKVTMSGFLPPEEAARVMAAADAVVLPIIDGGGGWNTSVHAAQAQGTFVLTTSRQRHGYDHLEHTYYAAEDDLEDMRRALRQYKGTRTECSTSGVRAWHSIGQSHADLYKLQISKRMRAAPENSEDNAT